MSRTFRASYNQQTMWHDYHVSGRNPVYHIALPAIVEGRVDVDVLRGCLQDVVDRHSALRTSFLVDHGRVDQVVHDRVPVDFEVMALDGPEAAGPDATLERLANAPFDLTRDPPLRVRLLLGPPRPLLLFVVHHVACDFESLVIILEELGELYRGRRSGSGASRTAVACHGYHEFARWEGEYAGGERGRRALAYWTRQLEDRQSRGDLSLDRPRGARRTYAGAELETDLPSRVVAGITRIGEELQVTRNAVLLTAAHVLVARLSASRSAVVGLTSSQRQGREFRRTVGNFTNPIVTTSDLRTPATFRDLLLGTSRQVMRSLPYSALPFPLLVERLDPGHDASRTPFFDVLYTYNRSRRRGQDTLSGFIGGYGALDLGELALRQVPLRRIGSNVDLSLIVFDSQTEIRLVWQYNTDLLDVGTVRRFADCYRELIEAGSADPGASLDAVASPVSAAESVGSAASAPVAGSVGHSRTSLTDLLERQAARTPDRVAVTSGGTSLTYARLHRRADRLAARLRAEGVGPDEPVGVLLAPSPRLTVGMLGVIKAGAAHLPLDPGWSAAALRAVVADSGARVVVTERGVSPRDGLGGPRLIHLDPDPGGDGAAPVGAEGHPDPTASVVHACWPAGEPQAVLQTDRGMATTVLALRERHTLDASDVLLPEGVAGAGWTSAAMWWPLTVGARVVLAEPGEERRPGRLARLIRRHGVTVVYADVTALGDALADRSAEPPSSLRLVIRDGRPLTGAQLVDAESRLGCAVDSVHGWAETGGPVTWRPTGYTPATTGAVGGPARHVHCHVLDDRMRPVPPGVPGELYVAAPHLAHGYPNRPGPTAERFRPDPFRPGRRVFRTGERVRQTGDDLIEYLGPVGDQVTVAGHRVGLDEVRRLVEADEEVASAVPVAVAEHDGRPRLLAYVVPIEPAAFVPASLWGRLRSAYPDYLVPSGIMPLDRWPTGPAGEIAVNRLPAPSADVWLDRDTDYVAPRSPLEREIARLWEGLLDIDEVGAFDDFFAIGGHSVMATRLVVRMRRRFGVELSVEDLFAAPRLADFTETVVKRAADAGSHAVDGKGKAES